ncbi:MAG: TIGR02757 family protein [Deferribacterales bacterium]
MVRRKKVGVSLKSAQNVGVQILLKNRANLYNFLEDCYLKYNRVSYIATDPIFFPAYYDGNKEFISFISAIFSYGKVSLIQRFLEDFFSKYGTNPIIRGEISANIYYRFQKSGDIYLLWRFLKKVYDEYGSINNYFLYKSDNIDNGLREFILDARVFGSLHNAGNGYFQLFPNPDSSGLKRFRMFLRWMIRKDDVDFGIWRGYSPKDLLYPIDTHILRFAKAFGIIKNEVNSNKNSKVISEFFSSINPQDPVKYDFTITRLGMLSNCSFVKNNNCLGCSHLSKCPF